MRRRREFHSFEATDRPVIMSFRPWFRDKQDAVCQGIWGYCFDWETWWYNCCHNCHMCMCNMYYHVVFEFGEQRAKINEWTMLQIISGESCEEKKKCTKRAQLLYATVISLLWLHYENPPPAVAHICHPLLRSHNIFSLRRTYGSKSMEWPVMLHCCCLAELFTSPLETTSFSCELCEGFYLDVCSITPFYCKKTSETVVGREQTVCASALLSEP